GEIYRVGAGRLQYQQAVLQARTAYDGATRDVLNLLGAREQDVQDSIAQALELQPVALRTGAVDPQFPDSLRSAPLQIVAEFDDRPIIATLDELRSIALTERPDVIAARHLLTSSESAVHLAQAQRMRDVDTA